MTSRLQRYDMHFLRDFRAPIAVNAAVFEAQEAAAPLPPPPTYNDDDLSQARDVAKKLGYAEGFEAGLAQANTEAHAKARDLANALEKMREHVAQLAGSYQQLIDQQAAELTELVLLIARKVAGEALAAHGTDTVRGLVERCLPVVFGKPKVVIELAPSMVADAEEAIRLDFEQAGFSGELECRALDTLEPSDVRVSWASGEANRSTAALWAEIEALLHSTALTPTLPTTEPGDHHD